MSVGSRRKEQGDEFFGCGAGFSVVHALWSDAHGGRISSRFDLC